MYRLSRRFIVLYNVNLFASSWNPHFLDTVTNKITLYLKRVTNLATQINDRRNTVEPRELELG